MREMDGLTLLHQIKTISPETTVIMMTAYGTVETAVKAIKLGAYDFLLKPVSPEALEHILSAGHRSARTCGRRTGSCRRTWRTSSRISSASSKIMKEIFDLIQSVANARSTVMITGSSGTGKEMVARAIHYASNRAQHPFIKLNCAALPENLVEAELFGYEKGAFTDAKKTNRGRFELADGGTLLLDEISEMPLNLQSKLLRVIQEREFERVGSSQTISVDVRIIATSNRNLKEFISQGLFREDLFYRLNVIPIYLPPLADRKEDIPALTQHFIEKYNQENGRSVKKLDDQVMRMFLRYHWPGNVRELENMLERAVVTAKADILTDDDFPTELALGPVADDLPPLKVPMKLEEGSKYLILKTLEKFNGNKTKAAEALGITTRTIRNKLAEYQLESPN